MGRTLTDKTEIEKIIQKVPVCRLGLSIEGKPYVVPLNFAYEDNILYIHSRLTGKKLDILKDNPAVCIEFDIPGEYIDHPNPCRAGFSYESVVGLGTAGIVENLEEKNRALSLITEKYSRRSHIFSAEEMGSVAVVKVEFSSLTGKASG